MYFKRVNNYLELLHGYFRPSGVVQDEENIYPDPAEDPDLQLQHQTRDERAQPRDEVRFCDKEETVNFAAYRKFIWRLSRSTLLLFVLHIGLTTLTSTMKMTAAIMIAARAARGMKLKYGVRNSRAKITSAPGNTRANIVSKVQIFLFYPDIIYLIIILFSERLLWRVSLREFCIVEEAQRRESLQDTLHLFFFALSPRLW